MVGKGSLKHNSREFYAPNVDPSRSHLNVEFCKEDIRTVYHELFDAAQQRYNARQTRSDRRIADYYTKISSSKQEKPFHEIVLQIGNKDDTEIGSETAELARQCLEAYVRGFQARNRTLRMFSAHLHMDEATPHVHIDFVPYITGSKRGMDTRVSLKQALAQMGFVGGTRSATEWNLWVQREKQVLADIMQEHGIEWEQLGTHEEHLSVLEYKKQERSKEVKELDSANETGYQTPKLDTRAAIFQNGKILLVKENSGKWSLPGGWVDVNVSVKENTIKEVKEEAGLDVTADKVIAIQDRSKHNLPVYAYGVCKIFVLCTIIGGAFKENIETTGFAYFSENELPELATEKNNEEQVKMCFEAYRTKNWSTLFD